jgi:Arc/MetJ family transcription regulator
MMRTNIDIDDQLMAKVMAATGLKTKKAVVNRALSELLAAHHRLQALEEMRGMGWDGDLDAMRQSRKFDIGE